MTIGRFGLVLTLVLAAPVAGRSPSDEGPEDAPTAREEALEERLRQTEEANAALVERLRTLTEKVDALSRRLDASVQPAAAEVPAAEPASGPPVPAAGEEEDQIPPLPRQPMPPVPSPDPVLGITNMPNEPTDPTQVMPGAADRRLFPGLPGGPLPTYPDPVLGITNLPDEPTDVRGPIPGTENIAEETLEEEKPFAFRSGYDNGFVIRPNDPEKTPFELRVNGRIQFRYEHFEPNEPFWFNSAGDKLPILARNNFSIPRARLDFRGFTIDPKLQYRLTLNATTNRANAVSLLYYWVNYEFSEAFNLHFGRNFVPGSRYWSNGSSRLQFAGRSLATTFFQPGRSTGIWATGTPAPGLFYWISISNAFRGDSIPTEIDRNFVYSGTGWYDLFDNYGDGYSDLEWHDDLALRIGNSFTFTQNDGKQNLAGALPEEDAIRLTDGTPLDQRGALAPGVTVDQFDLYLYAIDAGLKYRGFSLNGEYYMRWLQGLRGDGALPRTNLFDNGFVAQGGYFLIPERLELIARTSQIFGEAGTAEEYAGGLNWFFTGDHRFKLTIDATKVIGSPTRGESPNYRPGDTGVLFRSQIQVAF